MPLSIRLLFFVELTLALSQPLKIKITSFTIIVPGGGESHNRRIDFRRNFGDTITGVRRDWSGQTLRREKDTLNPINIIRLSRWSSVSALAIGRECCTSSTQVPPFVKGRLGGISADSKYA